MVRVAAAETLGDIRAMGSVSGLIEALDDQTYVVCEAAAQALRQIGTPEALAAVEAWRASQEG
jgi:HEAT repeat protein